MIAGKLYPKDTVVEVLDADHPLVQRVFPSVKANIGSSLIAVRFLDRDHVTVGLTKSFTDC